GSKHAARLRQPRTPGEVPRLRDDRGISLTGHPSFPAGLRISADPPRPRHGISRKFPVPGVSEAATPSRGRLRDARARPSPPGPGPNPPPGASPYRIDRLADRLGRGLGLRLVAALVR